MALSNADVPNTVPDIPVIAQHYLVCGNEECNKNTANFTAIIVLENCVNNAEINIR